MYFRRCDFFLLCFIVLQIMYMLQLYIRRGRDLQGPFPLDRFGPQSGGPISDHVPHSHLNRLFWHSFHGMA
jgi:hypothetical protein